MLKRFTKNKIIVTLLLCLSLVINPGVVSLAQDQSSSNFTVEDPVLDGGQQSSSSTNFSIGQSVNQPAIGKSSSSNFQLWSGFQYFFKADSNTLTATAGDGQVSLSWTTPSTYLGIDVSSYDLGTGTTSGSYTFESVGAVTSYVKTGLTNDTTYYFVVRAKATGGLVITTSTEASATPTASSVNNGGGGSVTPPPSSSHSVLFQGLASPNSQVSILQDLTLKAQATTDNLGQFSIYINNTATGTSNFVISYKDPTGLRSQPVSFLVSPNTNAEFNNLLLPPTLTSSLTTIKQGDSFGVSGYTAPGSQVLLSLLPDLGEFSATANQTGQFNLQMPTNNLDLGEYRLEAISNLFGLISKPSSIISFLVGRANIDREPVFVCGDFNGDGRVNIIDFSILIYWYSKPNPPGRVDCNKDQKIDIYDVSILMFNWTG